MQHYWLDRCKRADNISRRQAGLSALGAVFTYVCGSTTEQGNEASPDWGCEK